MDRRVIIFDSQDKIGMFATLYYAVAAAKYCERRNLIPLFVSSNPYLIDQDRSQNWVEYFFEYNFFDGDYQKYFSSAEVVAIKDRRSLNKYMSNFAFIDIQNRFSSVSECAELFFKHLSIKQDIRAEVDEFANAHMTQAPVIGIHYRGTDKHFDEADPVAFEQVIQSVTKYGGPAPRIFLATDDVALPGALRERFGQSNVIMRREPSGLSHYEDLGDNYTKGRDALIDCLLLSRCALLVKTPSQLSAWSKVFNLDLKLVLLGEPYKRSHNFELFGKWYEFHIPLKNKGYFPESALYNPKKRAMERNRVLEIMSR